MPMLPVTPRWQRGPGYWGSPYGRPERIELRHFPHGYRVPKGVWMIVCGPNHVDLVWREDDDFDDEPRRMPGTGMIGPRRRRPRRTEPVPHSLGAAATPRHCPVDPPWPKPPPCPPGPPGPGDNSLRRTTLIQANTTGVVFSDGHSVILSGIGEATTIRVFST
jgi:hypothetical protein